ncbi:MAG: AbrB family transcriptional regulator [Actinobacteria bacterium HGW-Actinobacteria-6]|jgi:AbrB family looped-hinge helix DNA binding protein|nr:MAG: AbrB family transcriptional regulator [Actinobacteria bacterium HGW-Actinobacteria-6]
MAENDTCSSCGPVEECCTLEAVVSVDERGQLVLPKDLRVRAGIAPGDRLAVVSYPDEDGGICCITLVKAGAVAGAVRSVIGPAIGVRPKE